MSLSIPSAGARVQPPAAADEPVVVRPASSTSTVGATDSAAGSGAGEDAALVAPKPLRFPWLSRLSQQLESASKSKPSFPSAPVIGENVDRKV